MFHFFHCGTRVYCKSGNFRSTFIFVLFALNLATAKIKTHEYVLYMSPSMEQKSKITNKKTIEFALNWLTLKMYTGGNYPFYSKSLRATQQQKCWPYFAVFL